MSQTCCENHASGGKAKCAAAVIAYALIIIGALNWGLIGLGLLLGKGDWNVVRLILGSSTAEAVVYLLVGIGAIAKLLGCRCSKCTPCGNPESAPRQ